jgi:hypothetical protein
MEIDTNNENMKKNNLRNSVIKTDPLCISSKSFSIGGAEADANASIPINSMAMRHFLFANMVAVDRSRLKETITQQ